MVLEVRDLRKSYKKGFIPRSQLVLKGLSFQLQAGTVTGFLGANGAGKTTTMKCVLGLARPDAGEVRYFGGQLLTEDIKRRIGFLPERPYFYEYLTGVEFLRFYGQLSLRFSRRVLDERIAQLLKRVDLLHAKDKPLRSYSKGMLQKIGIAQALIHEPEFVILDEPMSGLDPDGRLALNEIIHETAQRGTAIFFSSHLFHDAERLCQNLVVLRDGQTIYQGSTRALLETHSTAVEIGFETSQGLSRESVANASEAQERLKTLLQQGARVHELRPLRPTLEEIFVKIALRGESR